MALFGSGARDQLTAKSDIDLLARFAPDAEWTLLDHVRMQDELTALLDRPVDLVSRSAVEADRNHLRRAAILGTARTLYAAGGGELSRGQRPTLTERQANRLARAPR